MDSFLPLFEARMQTLAVAFHFVVFAMLVVGLIVHLSLRHHHGGDLIRPLVRAIIIISAVAAMSWWFPLVENTFLAAADYINASYRENPTGSADTIREQFAQSQNPEGQSWSWRRLNESISQALTSAIIWFFVQISTLISAPMLILQYILRWVLYLLTPFALACFMIPSLAGHGIRFFQQVLAILAWPVGFAISNLVAIAIWQDFWELAKPNPDAPALVLASPFLTNSGGILASIVLIVGTISTPLICQMFFAQGNAFTGASASPVTIGRNVAGAIPRRASASPVPPASHSSHASSASLHSHAAPASLPSRTVPGL